MKADTVDLVAIFGTPVTYMVPLFQRPYVWKLETEWAPLWEDIEAVLERQLDDSPANDTVPHFLGAVVLDQVLNPIGKVQVRNVIDGQQRLTTLQLFISAARELASRHGLDGPRQMLEKLLFNEAFLVKQPDDRYKVLPTVFDRDAFRAVIDGVIPEDSNVSQHRMMHAHEYFTRKLETWAITDKEPDETARRFEVLSTALWKLLVVVAIDLDHRDNAQVIFETLNARGTPLLASDLIKNHLFQVATAREHDIDALYAKYWQPLDEPWWRQELLQGRLKRPRLDVFMNHYLAMKLGHEVVSHLLFPEFKRYLANCNDEIVGVLAELRRYSKVYESFERKPESPDFGRFLYRLNAMEVSTAYPTLLWMCGEGGIGDASERLRAARAIESWLVRRVITRANTQGYTNVFLSLLNFLRESDSPSAADVVTYLTSLEGDRSYWPTDEQVRAALRTTPVYTALIRARLRMILEALETKLREKFAEEATVPQYLTIEHILPQE